MGTYAHFKVQEKSNAELTFFLPGGANGPWADSNLDDIGSGKDECFDHVTGHNISGLEEKLNMCTLIKAVGSKLNCVCTHLLHTDGTCLETLF